MTTQVGIVGLFFKCSCVRYDTGSYLPVYAWYVYYWFMINTLYLQLIILVRVELSAISYYWLHMQLNTLLALT